ncbi:hypothetical protein HU200_052889 [Digitaria exilis]|uniref:Protein kinase domain-containing protein n=1 Tax=Digitaria exilis TaxID=1010633 RepID=A0A835ANI0_9POAL|nr:hypothetical protein HU200_052889 [Digitaria exilis]
MEEPEELPYQLLREITDGFSEERKVGEGAFGTVYRGVTKCGEDVAVKILQDGIHNLDYRQFQNEFYNLAKVKHNNIVQVLGYCYEIEPIRIEYNGRIVFAEKIHKALCFEYLHNGCLGNHLSDESCGLEWHTRYKIIKGTCEGLRYIHEGLEESLLHLDLKPENILLDKNMVPKIADFGLSRIFGDKLTRTTQSPLGSLGYQPPEYIERGEISEKFDIYSLGVVIIRIVSGQEGYFKYKGMTSDEFIDHVQKNWRKRWHPTCSGGFLLEACRQIETCTQIALNCLEYDSSKRPDIVKIVDKLNEIETDSNEEHKVKVDQHHHPNFSISSRKYEVESDKSEETSQDAGEELIIGRDKEKKKIIASLLESMSDRLVILPIYGIGGIGKTTFVKLIYNDISFKYYSHIWVYVSPRFDLDKIGKSIVSQLSGKENQANEIQLMSKKTLIVLDDLWEDNTFHLEDLKKKLNLGDRMVKTIVLVTTRSAHIARKICSNIEPYNIDSLADETCWDIIKQKSGFEARHDKEKMVGIGKEIAQKCKGVALAAQTLGSMLKSLKYDQWIVVKDSEIWNETISMDTSLPNHVLASLKLSYVSLDDRLKSCFTYCAIYPKGHKIVKYDLIHQWMSLGFIKPTKLFSTLQLCEKYIVQLLGLAFLQHSVSPMTHGAYGEYGTVFTMHDLVHDLAISILGEKILDPSKQDKTGGSTCCYALLTDCSKSLQSCMSSPASLCALRFLDCRAIALHGAAVEPAESLQVLDLSECSINKLPDCIGALKQLKYLNAPRIRDRMVPECIVQLSKLRYLSLHGSCTIRRLPESIGDMEDLVHLDLSGCLGIEKLPESFGNLKCLEHLDFANCKKISGISKFLARLTKLQYLNLSNCKNIGYLPKALARLTELNYLNLSYSSYLSGNKYLKQSSSSQLQIIRLPEALRTLTELKYLNLSNNFTEGKLPAPLSFGTLCNLDVAAALNGLTKLQYLNLYACSSLRAMEGLQEAFGKLSELRHLNLGSCIIHITSYDQDQTNSLLQWICNLTKLEYLNLCRNDNIEIIPETLANLRRLHTLDVSWCGSLHSLPASLSGFDRLQQLYTTGCWMLDRSTLPWYMSSSKNSPHFVAHTGDGESSCYSFQLKYEIHNRLMISRLENVKSAKEAQTINLVEKRDITGLTLEWTRDAKRFMDDAEVLRELEPPYNVSNFHLQGYNSFSFPSWVMHLDAYLPDLTRIDLSDLPSCRRLPPLGQLPNLKLLDIRRMHSFKKIDADLYGGTRAFPRLKHFRLDDMECLEEWNMAYSIFPVLRYLSIRHCPRLRFEPRPPRSLYELRVESSDQVMSFWKENRSYIECSVPPLQRWRWSDLTFLRTLFVRGCESMVLPESLGGLTTLSECDDFKTLPYSIRDELWGLSFLKIDGSIFTRW